MRLASEGSDTLVAVSLYLRPLHEVDQAPSYLSNSIFCVLFPFFVRHLFKFPNYLFGSFSISFQDFEYLPKGVSFSHLTEATSGRNKQKHILLLVLVLNTSYLLSFGVWTV